MSFGKKIEAHGKIQKMMDSQLKVIDIITAFISLDSLKDKPILINFKEWKKL